MNKFFAVLALTTAVYNATTPTNSTAGASSRFAKEAVPVHLLTSEETRCQDPVLKEINRPTNSCPPQTQVTRPTQQAHVKQQPLVKKQHTTNHQGRTHHHQ
ncbi:MAG TPA: hypothetical protein DIC42_02870 [Holosporales bacterium]|nr:hypothetical protein [Holosporales bacterium]